MRRLRLSLSKLKARLIPRHRKVKPDITVQLRESVLHGEVAQVKAYLHKGANPLALNHDGWSALHIAAFMHNKKTQDCFFEMVRFVLYTPSLMGDLPLLKALTQDGSNILHLAFTSAQASPSFIEGLEAIIGPKGLMLPLMRQTDVDGQTPLHVAAQRLHPKSMLALVNCLKPLETEENLLLKKMIMQEDAFKRAPLQYAALMGDPLTLVVLIKAVEDKTWQEAAAKHIDLQTGESLLHFLAQSCTKRFGAHLNKKDAVPAEIFEDENTMKDYFEHLLKSLDFLKNKGVALAAKNQFDTTALDIFTHADIPSVQKERIQQVFYRPSEAG